MTDHELSCYIVGRQNALAEDGRRRRVYKLSESSSQEYSKLLLGHAINDFAAELYDKALKAREKYGFNPLGWAYPDWEAELQKGLSEHLLKGDPRDVAVYALFAYFHGWNTAALATPPPAAPDAGLLGELARLDALATPGPWALDPADGGSEAGLIQTADGQPICQVYGNTYNEVMNEEYGEHDAQLIPLMRNALPALLARHGAPAAAWVAGNARRWEAESEHRTGNIFLALVLAPSGEGWHLKDAHWDGNGMYWSHADHFEVLDVRHVLIDETDLPEFPAPPTQP